MFLAIGCSIKPPQVNYSNYKIDTQSNIDSTYIKLLMPYKDSLDKSMNEVIGFSVYGLFKKQPESTVGNFMTDAIKLMAEKKYNKKVDAAFVNFGGIRSYIPKGDITVGKIFELMPFDNLVVLQELSGIKLKAFINRVCEKGGWPVSQGLTYVIKDKTAIEILINGIPINDNTVYTIANSDYIANGGDNCDMLKNIPKQNINYLMRDALIEYTRLKTAEGKPIDAKLENRVIYGK
ncbi:MAG: 5'-nucleotidase C-terminal domain-containing protein [Chitinophagaceae bacterium]